MLWIFALGNQDEGAVDPGPNAARGLAKGGPAEAWNFDARHDEIIALTALHAHEPMLCRFASVDPEANLAESERDQVAHSAVVFDDERPRLAR